MSTIVYLSLLPTIIIFLGLIILNSVTLTFIMFYGFVCVLIPFIDLVCLKRYSVSELLKSLGFSNFRKTFLIGIVLGLIYLSIIYLFFSIFREYVLDIGKINSVLIQWKINNRHLYLFLFIMIFANSFLEEIYWRGYIFHKLKNKTNSFNIILVISLFYALYHLITTVNLFSLFWGSIFTLFVFLVGVFWGYLRYKFQSLYIPITSHLCANLGIMLIYVKYFST